MSVGNRKNGLDWTNRTKAVCDTAKVNICSKQKCTKKKETKFS